MRNIPASIFFVIVGVLVVSLPLLAHHGNAAFDSTSVTVKGTVTDWTWGNPHCFVMFDVKDQQGNIVHWVAETSNPSDMVESERRQNDLMHPGIGVTDRLNSPQKRMCGSDLVVPVGPNQKQVPHLRVRDQMLEKVKRCFINPL